jgi:PPM family protein phosphatase
MIEAVGVTDTGCIRKNNEDSFVVAPDIDLYAVADGMGGAQAGEHASRLAVESLSKSVATFPNRITKDHLLQAFADANDRVMEAAAADQRMEGMGTTLVAAVPNDNDLMIASVGDSRAYAFENGELKAITEDQSWVNEVGRRLGLEEAILKNHPMRHVLTMAIGVSDQLRVNCYSVPLKPGLVVLLSTDGLHGVATEEEITKILAGTGRLEDKCRQLIKAARKNGGPDNITAVLLKAS